MLSQVRGKKIIIQKLTLHYQQNFWRHLDEDTHRVTEWHSTIRLADQDQTCELFNICLFFMLRDLFEIFGTLLKLYSLDIFRWKTQLEEIIVIVELGESQPSSCIQCKNVFTLQTMSSFALPFASNIQIRRAYKQTLANQGHDSTIVYKVNSTRLSPKPRQIWVIKLMVRAQSKGRVESLVRKVTICPYPSY